MVLQILLELFFAGDRLYHSLFSFADVIFHLPDDLLNHPFGVFDTVNQFIDVGSDDIVDPFKDARHNFLPQGCWRVGLFCPGKVLYMRL